MGDDRPTDEELDRLQWTTVLYYLHETNPDNGPALANRSRSTHNPP
jgi:hypothetical protein